MEINEYRNIFLQEKQYWLYVGIRRLARDKVNKFFRDKPNLKLLDAGCGTGGFIDEFKQGFECYGVDISEEAIKFCKKRNLANILQASVDKIPFADNVFNVVTTIDVIYHLLVEDESTALRELYRVLHEDGILILNLPAFEFLRSGHDHIVHTRRRYLKTEVAEMVRQAGFIIIRITYRNTIFFPLACALRIFNRLKRKRPESDLKSLPTWLNKLLIKILMVENKALHYVNLPIGLSIFCIAKK